MTIQKMLSGVKDMEGITTMEFQQFQQVQAPGRLSALEKDITRRVRAGILASPTRGDYLFVYERG